MESFIVEHLGKNLAIDKYIIGATDGEDLKLLYTHGIVYTPDGYMQGIMHKQKMNISWGLMSIGYPCHHSPEITGIKCTCSRWTERMKCDIVSQQMLPVSKEQVREAMAFDNAYITRNLDRLINFPDLIIGVCPLLTICQALKGRRVRSFIASLGDRDLSVDDTFTVAAISKDIEECMCMMARYHVKLDVFGCYGFAKKDTKYRVAMIEEGLSRGLLITGKAKIFVRKNRRSFSNKVIKQVLGEVDTY